MKKFDPDCRAVVMCGISGSGKTLFARRLEAEGFFRLSTDALIWEKARERLNSLSADEKHRLFAECRLEIRERLASLLKAGERVVVDSTQCKRMARDEIRTICREAGIAPVFVYCHAEKDDLLERISQRKGTGPDDLIVTPEELSSYWLGFERPQPDETDFITME